MIFNDICHGVQFNVQSSYQEDMHEYTTELKEDNSEEFKQRSQRAALLARRKETDHGDEDEDDDRTEEDKFSSVTRSVDQQPTASQDVIIAHVASDCTSETGNKSPKHAVEPDAKPDDQLTGEPVEEETQSTDTDPVNQNLRNQTVRTGGGSRQPNMPSIPEDQAIEEGRNQRHKMMKEFKDLRDFSENFTLGDKTKSTHPSADSTSQPEKDVVSVSTLNPEAKAFKPASLEPLASSPVSHPQIIHSPVYSPVSPQLHIAHPHVPVQQPPPQFIASPVVNYHHGQPLASVHMQHYPPTPMPPQIRQRPHHISAHIPMQPEMPGSPGMTSVPQPMYVAPSPPVQYGSGPPQVVPVPAPGPPMAFVPVGSPDIPGPVILMQQQQPYHQPPYGQPIPGPHLQPGPTMMPSPYVIGPGPQAIHYNTPPSSHMHQMQFAGPLHPLAAPSQGPVDHRAHQSRHGPSPPLLPQHPSPAIPIPSSGRSPYPVGPGSQGPMG
jgi:hypothetical protein